MKTPLFDTHATVKKLAGAGMPETQAEVLVQTLAELTIGRLATKDDLAVLKQELRAEFRTDLKDLELRIADRLRSQMLWFFTMLVGVVGLAVAILKFL